MVQTDFGEQTIEEVVKGYTLWKRYMERCNTKRWLRNQTEEGKQANRAKAKAYYEQNKDKVLEKRRLERAQKN
jgi:hypothetical protein